jgi:hypothetical protein
MASVEVLRGDDASTHMSQLFHNMRLGSVEPRTRGGTAQHPLDPLAQVQFGKGPTLVAHTLVGACVQTPVDEMLPARPVDEMRPAHPEPLWAVEHPLQPRPQPQRAPHAAAPQAVLRPPSPDSRYLTTDWSAQDAVDQELSFLMCEQAGIRDDGPRLPAHDLSYIS